MADGQDDIVTVEGVAEVVTRETAAARDTVAASRGVLEHLPVGTELGRYVLLERIGQGGMGVVYSAYDPKLDRRVALKLLLSGGRDPIADGARLLREAQALAKLSHPNVVTVHDAGLLGDAVYIEMEFVEGKTLDEHVRDLDWREIVRAYAEAGRALDAAHAAGIVHRDFKPTNVIVDKSGRVRVLDFGLARAVGANAYAPPVSGELRARAGSSEDEVRASAMLPAAQVSLRDGFAGTPAFMPPEQWLGRETDATADQYAFAASLFESLYGVLPFPKATFLSMRSASSRGAPSPRPSGTRVPIFVHRALETALAYEPGARFGSMKELLDALLVDPRARRRRWMALFAALASAAGIATLGVRAVHARDERVCSEAALQVRDAWGEAKEAQLSATFAKSKSPLAAEALVRTRSALTTYATSWSSARERVCREARGRDELRQAPQLACLDARLNQLRALTDALASDAELVDYAVHATSGLEPIKACETTTRSVRQPASAARTQALRARVAEAESRRLAGRPKAARTLALALALEAREGQLREAEGVALLAQGRAERDDGDYKAAARTLEAAIWASEASGDEPTMVSGATLLAFIEGTGLADEKAAARWEQHALAVMERLGDPDNLGAELDRVRSTLARQRKDLAVSHSLAERALSRSTSAFGARSLQTAHAEHNLGNSFVALARWDEALAHYDANEALLAELVGPRHPDLASPLVSKAVVLRRKGDSAGAIKLYGRAIELLVAGRGPKHPDVLLARNNLGIAMAAAGDWAGARESFEEALRLRRETLGDEHPAVAATLANLADVDLRAGRRADARASLLRAIAIHERSSGKMAPALTTPLLGLAEVELRDGHPKEALVLGERALAIRSAKLEPNHPDLGEPHALVGRAELALGQTDRATPHLERALELFAKGNELSRAETSFALARALAMAGRPTPRIDELLAVAEQTYSTDPASPAGAAAEVRAFRARRTTR